MVATRSQAKKSRAAALAGSTKPYDTPTKAAVKAAIRELEKHKGETTRTKHDIFREYGVSAHAAYRWLNQNDDRTHLSSQPGGKTMGRPPILTAGDLLKCQDIVINNGPDGRQLTWEQLASEANLDVSGRTLKRHMKTKDYSRCIASRKASPNHN